MRATFDRYRRLVVILLGAVLLLAGALPGLAKAGGSQVVLCPGDCRGRGRVAVSDLALGVRIVLGLDSPAECPAMDPFRTGQIMVAQLIRAVSSVLFGCGEMIQDTLTDFDVIDLGAAGQLRIGAPPPPTAGGPTLSVPAAATVPGGITADVPIEASAPIEKIFLAIDNAFGYYEVVLPQPVTVFPADVTFANAPPRTKFDCLFSVADTQGRVGTFGVTSITIAREQVDDTITNIRGTTTQPTVTLIDGLPPPATGGPIAQVPDPGLLLPGVTTTLFVQADVPYSTVIYSIDGAAGYYRADFPSPSTRRLFDVTISGALMPGNQFFILASVILPDGRVGPPGATRITVIADEDDDEM